MATQLKLKRDTEIYMATRTASGVEIDVLNEWPFEDAQVYVCSDDAYGMPRCVIVAKSFEDAYEAFIDYLPTVPQDELYEAYGFESDDEFQEALDSDECPELCDGYSYQANFSGTGVVDTMYVGLTPWSRHCGVRLHIGWIE
jgi:hypothetical protein